MVSLNPEQQPQAQQSASQNKNKSSRRKNTSATATGTKFHPNNQVKADYPKKPSPFTALLKEYKYEGGEITRWFVDAWDNFDTFEQACEFMYEQISAKKYRSFCFPADWPAILHRFLFIRANLKDGNQDQVKKLYATVSQNDAGRDDRIFNFTNQFVIAASSYGLDALAIRTAINNLNAKMSHNQGNINGNSWSVQTSITATPDHKSQAMKTLDLMHAECVLEWANAMELQISDEQFKGYVTQMVSDNDLVGAAIIITKKKFHKDFDIADIMVKLIEDLNRMDTAKNIVKGHREYEKLFIEILVSLKNVKSAVKYVKEFGLDPLDFPQMVELASFNAANYFVSQCFRGPTHPDHIPMHKVEDLFSGDETMIACLVTLLLKRWVKVCKCNPSEALIHKTLGIIKRHNLQKSKQTAALQDLMTQAESVTYQPQQDKQPQDSFGPIKEGALRMENSVTQHFISTEAEVELLGRLKGKPLIGMDSEWRPTVKPFAEQVLAIFQLSSDTDAYIIDLIALKDNMVLDAMLTEIFTDERTLSLGFAFASDTSMFKQSLPAMNFFKRFARFLDVQTYWQAIKKEKNQIGLAKVVESIYKKPLCKGEQMSNWEKRPLRKTQLHYAALDAACLPELATKMGELAALEEHAADITIENFTRELVFGQKLEVPDVISDPSEKKDNKKDRRKRKRGPRKKKSAQDDNGTDSDSYTLQESSEPVTEEEKKE